MSLGDGDLDMHSVLVELASVGFLGLLCIELVTLPPSSEEDRIIEDSRDWRSEAICSYG